MGRRIAWSSPGGNEVHGSLQGNYWFGAGDGTRELGEELDL
jgi:hypothetical protein